jgi:hypothetical protein
LGSKDETWDHQYAPETKLWSKQWVEARGSVPKKAKWIASARKVTASVFWDAEGILSIDYLEKGRAITGEYHFNLLDQLDAEICQKRLGLKNKENHLSSGRRTCSQRCIGDGNNDKIWGSISAFPLFS